MARLPRLALDGELHHVLLRGHDGRAIARDEADRAKLLDTVIALTRQNRVALHAYVLLEQRLQLLVTPEEGASLPRLMQSFGRSYVRYFNDRHACRGTLWEGRYRSTILQAELYLLPAMVELDLAAVRERLCVQAEDYRWSSYRHYAGLEMRAGLTPHPLVWVLGNTPFDREAAYREHVAAAALVELGTTAGSAFDSGWALGNAEFLHRLEMRAGRRVGRSLPGRPRKKKA